MPFACVLESLLAQAQPPAPHPILAFIPEASLGDVLINPNLALQLLLLQSLSSDPSQPVGDPQCPQGLADDLELRNM